MAHALDPEFLASTVLNAMADGFSVLDEEGRHIIVNDAMCEVTGFSREELVGHGPPHPYWPPEEYDNILGAFKETLDGKLGPHRLVFMRKDGTRFPCLVHPSQVMVKGTLLSMATVKDLTFETHQAKQIQQSQRLVESMLKGGDLAYWDWDMINDSSEFSDSYFTQLGFEPGAWSPGYEEWISRTHPDDIGAAMQSLQALIEGRSRLYDAEFRHLDAQGEWRWVLARGYVTERTRDGRPARITGTIQNVHRLRVQALQLRQLQKMELLGQLTGGIAHDFNNLLSIVAGNLQLLQLDAHPEQQELLEDMAHALTRASHLTRTLLRHHRKEPPRPRIVEVCTFVKDLTSMLRTALSTQASLEVRLDVPAAHVKVEPGELENALVNLVVNARDAMPEQGGQVQVRVAVHLIDVELAEQEGLAPGPYVVLSVKDNGAGMSPEIQTRAFEPLFTTKPPGTGTGLGLGQVRRCVQQAHGTLQLHSTEGLGTTVALSLPCVDEVPTAETRSAETTETLQGQETLLVVDDEARLLDVVARQLSALGYTVHQANNPREALSKLAQAPVDLLLTDLIMAYSLNGLELAQRARVIAPTLPIIFMTGYAGDLEGEAQQMGTVLHKPLSIEALGQTIRATLDAEAEN